MPDEYALPLALTALVVGVFSLLFSLGLAVVFRRTRRGARLPSSGVTEIDQLLQREASRLDALSAALAEQAAHVRVVDEQGRRAVQRVGVVRYNPFEDTGSNQSFALALLDAEGNGIVLSSLHSRQMTRLYLKAIAAGRSQTALSEEEAEALRRAGSTVHDQR